MSQRFHMNVANKWAVLRFCYRIYKNIHGHGPKHLLYFAYKIKDR